MKKVTIIKTDNNNQRLDEKIKKEIDNILWKHTTIAHSKGSCGELGESFHAIDSDDFDKVSDKIIDLIYIIFDPQNQPNQLGIENPFKVNKKIKVK